MITKENLMEALVDMIAKYEFLDYPNNLVENVATFINSKIQANDTIYFEAPIHTTLSGYSVDDKIIKRKMMEILCNDTSLIKTISSSLSDFNKLKKDWFFALFNIAKEERESTYFMFSNLNNIVKEIDEYASILDTKLFDSLLTSPKMLGLLNKVLIDDGIISEEKGADYFKSIRENYEDLYLYWLSIFFSTEKEYFKEILIQKLIDAVNIKNKDISYFYEIFEEKEFPEDLNLTEEEIDIILGF